jgi:hypothetical protein
MLYLPSVKHQTRLSLIGALGLLLALPLRLGSHEIPERVAVRAWVVPRDTVLTVLVRVPLEAMRDLDFPERPDGALDLVRVRALLPDAAKLWIADAIAVQANGAPLGAGEVRAVRLALPSDRRFESLEAALGSFAQPELGEETSIPWRQALLDVHLSFVIPREDAALALHPALAGLGIRTTSVVHIALADGTQRSLAYTGDPGLVSLDPKWWASAARFAGEGFWHILGGLDHLLFVFCLVLPVRRWRPLVALVTAFTVAHSITLGAAALGVVPSALWFPPLVEVGIAISILWLAIENVLLPTARLEARWRSAFAFGLVHGFGFSFALREELQFAGGNLMAALAAFNLGVEAGQLAVLAVALLVLELVRRSVPSERAHLVTWVGSALVAHSAWHWMTERWTTFGAFDIAMRLPVVDGTFALHAMRVALVGLIALAAALGMQQFVARFLRT